VRYSHWWAVATKRNLSTKCDLATSYPPLTNYPPLTSYPQSCRALDISSLTVDAKNRVRHKLYTKSKHD